MAEDWRNPLSLEAPCDPNYRNSVIFRTVCVIAIILAIIYGRFADGEKDNLLGRPPATIAVAWSALALISGVVAWWYNTKT